MRNTEGKFIANDVIKAFLQYRKEKNLPPTDTLMCEDELFTQFVGLYFAGADTTANFLNMIITYIGKYPEVQAKLREEID